MNSFPQKSHENKKAPLVGAFSGFDAIPKSG